MSNEKKSGKNVAAEASDTPVVVDENVIELDQPVPRKGGEITQITLRRPRSGELRGLSIGALAQMDVSALIVLVPRISSPTLTGNEVADMDPADMTKIALKVAGFLTPKAALMEASQSVSKSSWLM
ncbi:phage tail assembly protein [Leptospira sp. 96542]|nr:phage tail assembly protein [Leptospira sp. 96542]